MSSTIIMPTGACPETVAYEVYRNMSCGQDAAAPVFVIDDSSSAAEPVAAIAGDDAVHDIPSS